MIYLTMVPYLLLLAVNELTLFRTWFHLPAWLFVYGWHILILYILNQKLVMPLRLFVKKQTMIEPGLYYQNAFLSWLLAAGIAAFFSVALAAAPDITAQTRQNSFVFFIYTLIYSLIGMIINLSGKEASRGDHFPNYKRECGWLTLAVPLTAFFLFIHVLLLFSSLQQLKLIEGWHLLIHSQKMEFMGEIIFGSRLIIWVLISLFSAVLMMGNDAYEQKGFLKAFARRLAIHFSISGLLMIVFSVIMGILSFESSGGWMALIRLNGFLFLFLTAIFFYLWKSSQVETAYEKIYFQDTRRHNLIWTLTGAFFVLISAMQISAYFGALLMLALISVILLKSHFNN
ncbi:MAG TPA: hypothetical protein ENN84_10430 [Candidatus Marinimicrobia bacterium]|nr:hypothetical protein [Candidatus Neomarinimicrobiota bacterium]